MRPKLPLTTRLAQYTDQPASDIEATLDNPQIGSGHGPCWPWRGQLKITLPIMSWAGKPQPVRRVVLAACGVPMTKGTRTFPVCATPFCVNPNHAATKSYNRILGMTVEECAAGLSLDPETADLDDAAFMLYREPQPWDAAALAQKHDFPLELVERAIQGIEAGEL